MNTISTDSVTLWKVEAYTVRLYMKITAFWSVTLSKRVPGYTISQIRRWLSL